MNKNGKNWQKKINKLHLLISLIQSHPLGHNHGQGQAYETPILEGMKSRTSQSLFYVTLKRKYLGELHNVAMYTYM